MSKKEYKVEKITYTKADGSTSEREVITMSKPSINYMMIEVTELDPTQRQVLLAMLARHAEEMQNFAPSWKAMKPEGVVFLSE